MADLTYINYLLAKIYFIFNTCIYVDDCLQYMIYLIHNSTSPPVISYLVKNKTKAMLSANNQPSFGIIIVVQIKTLMEINKTLDFENSSQ